MTGPFTLAQVDELVTLSTSDGTCTFVFSTTVDQPDSVCWTSDIPHRPEADHVLRACFG
ncbi:hypothetical protein [Streptomyces sp. NPDC004728]|uniref:hypothetical protein n=1 Tax=Streptomyces sp. NPDC004728 TaxID=3154289 RepID=UPI0033BEF2FE